MAAVDAVGAAGAVAAASSKPSDDPGSAERFLKLLVTQMQNQDPLNPLDNAQVTSQIAQINTVSGIEKLNRTMEAMAGQFAQLQALQATGLVGREVLVEGDRLALREDGTPVGGFALDSAADAVQLEILGAAGNVVDTVDLGPRAAGRHDFGWTPRPGVDASAGQAFRIVARAGETAVAATPLMRDRVDAVGAGTDGLTLELRIAGPVPYGRIQAFH